jgi:anaerobic ribonucleoside-triphosphate reductase activating protein
MKQYISTITGPDVNNGEGIRLTLWFQGCSHNCPGCHNPRTHEFVTEDTKKDFLPLMNNKYVNKKVEKVLDFELSRQDIEGNNFYDGITISGGDALCGDDEAIKELILFVHWFHKTYRGMTIWIYTGFTIEYLKDRRPEIYNDLIKYCDVVVDGPFVLSKRDITLSFRGSSNQRIIKVSDLKFE